MKPEIVLQNTFNKDQPYTREQTEASRDEWIAAYREIAQSDHSKKELCDSLCERINRAANLLISREEKNMESDQTTENAENDCLNGDFPLGKEEDMAFASPYFTIKELALIQMGCADQIDPEQFAIGITETSVRKGFLAEIKGAGRDAVYYYFCYYNLYPVPPASVYERSEAIRRKLDFEDSCKYFQEACVKAEEYEITIYDIYYGYSNNPLRDYHNVCKYAETEEEKAIAKKCEQQMITCYQNILERNYKNIKAYKESGITDFTVLDSWLLTLDEKGEPKKTTVIGLNEYGDPVYADHCTLHMIPNKRSSVYSKRNELKSKIDRSQLTPEEEKAWFDRELDLYELKKAMRIFTGKGKLGADPYPTPNYDMSGLSREQSDAQAWQNYAIENGMVKHVDYDRTLKDLLQSIDECLDFYEKALSMV